MIILIGPSASGKTEIAQILEKKYNLKKVITHTTREKRINEKENVDYYFVSKETFLDMIKQNKLVEYTFYNNAELDICQEVEDFSKTQYLITMYRFV